MRNKLLEFLKIELIGPDPNAIFKQENNEEILIISPRDRYITGVLYPQGSNEQEQEKPKEDELAVSEDEQPQSPDVGKSIDDGNTHVNPNDADDVNDDMVNLANAYLPSAMGITCLLKNSENGLKIKVSAGRYRFDKFMIKNKDGEDEQKNGYHREPLDSEILLMPSDLPTRGSPYIKREIVKDNEPTGLELHIINRSYSSMDAEGEIYTFSLVNSRKSKNGRASDEDCFFQVCFNIESANGEKCFLPYEHTTSESFEETLSRELLYRHRKTFAIGHGCSPLWDDKEENGVSRVKAEAIPVSDVKAIIPTRLENINLNMYEMSDRGDENSMISNLQALCNEYEKWINKQEEIATREVLSELQNTARKHLENCKQSLRRMREGVQLIQSNDNVSMAFRWMNKAMLLQQIHYSLKLREWNFNEDKNWGIEDIQVPNIDNPSTWPRQGLGNWYPFQIAFILMNIKGIEDSQSKDREIVDLIWFPTGGGKTEAYLGLSAFTIFLRRLKNKNDDGTSVIMRYTLRLLTAQQFQRASSMICASEIIRKENEDLLGTNRISIGLWVGDDVTPNKREKAVRQLQDMVRYEKAPNPFILYKCPWCGAEMGTKKANEYLEVFGYELVRGPSGVAFKCRDKTCSFSSENLPLYVIDEDIYEHPPTLLIGTVDKFAMLVWNPEEIRRLFGFRNGTRVLPPELIIQDELHLISGPLGSMVGSFETLVDALCTYEHNNSIIKAKIIASTATVSRASEQINALYNRGKDNVSLFPAQAIRAGDSFFAYEDNDPLKARLYVGIHAAGFSHPTAHVRVLSALLQGVASIDEPEEVKNYYWTILDYFNSLRELGYAVTRIHADIPEYMSRMWLRMGLRPNDDPDKRRFIRRYRELTSRIHSSKIPQALQELDVSYSPSKNNAPIDICMATNMISVGVDVPRLGLMTVTGQPKTTSEYIQATSRVGRSSSGPGMVIAIYNTAKSRDRSHYERFHAYHSKIYSYVEPTSVTPFSPPVLDRTLHALLVGLARYMGSDNNRHNPQSPPDKSVLEKIERIILDRINGVDPSEYEYAKNLLREKIHEWSIYLPPKYGTLFPSWQEPALMYPWNLKPPVDYEKRSWPTPTSMRNVDPSCEGDVITEYGHE